MKFKNAGKYDGNPESLPHKEVAGAVQFKEFDNLKVFGIVMNIVATFVILLLLYLGWLRSPETPPVGPVGLLLSLLVMVPHEFLHACCFRGEVQMYSNLKEGMMFVIGTEDMRRARFVVMSMLPNIVFGFIPYLLYMIFPEWQDLGFFGAMCISMGAGDYLNVWNCLTQVPKGGRVYMSGIHQFWYMPEQN